jgi:hypothetical protein
MFVRMKGRIDLSNLALPGLRLRLTAAGEPGKGRRNLPRLNHRYLCTLRPMNV